MKQERILIFTDTHKQAQFETDVYNVQQGANDLIQIFESFQPYSKIKSLEDAEKLISDPLTVFDNTLQVNVKFQESGGKKGNPEIIAKLFDIDRDNYLLIIKGEKIIEGTCKPCSKLKIKQIGKGVISHANYQQYKKFLLWDNNRFTINEDLVSEQLKGFEVYAETDQAAELWHYWHNVVDTLNSLNKKGYCGDLHPFQVLLKERVMFSYATSTLALNEQELYHEIARLKNN